MLSSYVNPCVLCPCENEVAAAWKENASQSPAFSGQRVDNTSQIFFHKTRELSFTHQHTY